MNFAPADLRVGRNNYSAVGVNWLAVTSKMATKLCGDGNGSVGKGIEEEKNKKKNERTA